MCMSLSRAWVKKNYGQKMSKEISPLVIIFTLTFAPYFDSLRKYL